MIPDCIYEVHTHWGWFRLDEGAYTDYLAGKLWITRAPGKPQRTFDTPTAPANVIYKAIRCVILQRGAVPMTSAAASSVGRRSRFLIGRA